MAEVGVIGESPVDEEEESTEESESMFVLVVSASGVVCKGVRRLDVRGSADAVVHPPSQPMLRNNDLNDEINNERRVTGLETKTHSWLAMPTGEDSKERFTVVGALACVMSLITRNNEGIITRFLGKGGWWSGSGASLVAPQKTVYLSLIFMGKESQLRQAHPYHAFTLLHHHHHHHTS
jgi:hypothetical protein